MASGPLVLPALGEHLGFAVPGQGCPGLAKMPVHLSAHARTREQGRATELGGVQGQLVKGEDLAPSLEDAAPGTAAHTQCTILQFGYLLYAHFIGCSSYNHSSFVLPTRKLHLPDHLGRGHGGWLVWLLTTSLAQLEDGVGSSGQKLVQLDQQP